MGNTQLIRANDGWVPAPRERAAERRWYAAYTCARHEKSVVRQLELRCIESYLPLYEKVSLWRDRRVKVQLPLFSGYVFVHMAPEEKPHVLHVAGVVRLVGFGGHPAPLPEEEMEALRRGLSGMLHAEPCPYLQLGCRVRLKSGPLRGLQGVLLKKKTGYRFVLSLKLIQRSIAVEVGAEDIEAA